MAMRSVIHVGNFLSRRGYNRSPVEDLSDRMRAAGWEVHQTSSVEFRPFRLVDMAATVWGKRRHFAVGHISVFSGPAFLWAETTALAMRAAGRPFVLSLHGGNLPVFARRWPVRVRRLLASASAVVAPSRYLLETMRPYRADLQLIPNPIALDRFAFRLRRQAQPNLVWLRAFHHIYNPSLAPRVISELAAEFPAICLVMAGPDKGDGSREHTLQTIAELGVGNRITMPGKVSREGLGAVLGQGDIFINTTNIDNTPVSVLEAMASGLCVVSTTVGGIPYLMEHEKDALLVPPNDPRAMAAAVRRILSDPDLAQHLSSNARQKVDRFDWSKVLPQWESLFISVIDRSLN